MHCEEFSDGDTLTAIQSSWSQTTQSWIQTFRPVTSNPSVLKAVRSMIPWWSSLVLLALECRNIEVRNWSSRTWSHSFELPIHQRCGPRTSSTENLKRKYSQPEGLLNPECWKVSACSLPWQGSLWPELNRIFLLNPIWTSIEPYMNLYWTLYEPLLNPI